VRVWPECLSCLLTSAVNLARQVTEDEADVRTLVERTLLLRPFTGSVFDTYAAMSTMETWRLVVEMTGYPDPLAEKKREQNAAAMDLLPEARRAVADSTDPLVAALKLCIAGNVLDTRVGPLHPPAQEMIADVERQELDETELDEFRRRLRSTRSILYLTDNCGEVVFDRLFLETLRGQQEAEVVVVSRQLPTINDATVDDALSIGLDQVARVIGSGIHVPLPSTDLDLVSEEVRDLIRDADLIISKGGANFELLDEQRALEGKITFLMHGKCGPLCAVHNVARGALIVSNR
jgi:damage-control phosphatase, subfamily I